MLKKVFVSLLFAVIFISTVFIAAPDKVFAVEPCDAFMNVQDSWVPAMSQTSPKSPAQVNCVKALLIKIYTDGQGNHPNLPINGNFDNELKRIIEVFQDQNNLTVDGAVGKDTFPALLAAAGLSTTPTQTPTPTPTKRSQTVGASDLGCARLGLVAKDGLCFPEEVIKGEAGSLVASTKIGELIKNVLNILLTLAGVVAVLFLIIGSFLYMTAAGNEAQSTKGKKTMTVALVGLAVAALAYAIVTIIYNTLTTDTGAIF